MTLIYVVKIIDFVSICTPAYCFCHKIIKLKIGDVSIDTNKGEILNLFSMLYFKLKAILNYNHVHCGRNSKKVKTCKCKRFAVCHVIKVRSVDEDSQCAEIWIRCRFKVIR